MTDTLLETVRAIFVFIILLNLFIVGRNREVRQQKGLNSIVFGFCLVFFSMLIDITDNYPSLNRYVIIGDTPYQAFLEKFIGSLLGFFLIALGFWYWLPIVSELRKTEVLLKRSYDELEDKVQERTAQLHKEIYERKLVEEKQAELIEALGKSLDEVKTLRGILPICAFCKKIRDDQGYWKKVEHYVAERVDVDFSHGICPECMQEKYPENPGE